MINLNPPSPALAVKPWISLEVTRSEGFIQGVATTSQRSTLALGQVVELGLPFCQRLIVQSVNRSRIGLGCWLAIYLNARPVNAERKLTRQLGGALKEMLTARGIPPAYISINNTETVGAIPLAGDNPVDLAAALGYLIYCDAELKVKLTPKIPQGEMLGDFSLAELATYEQGEEGPLSANRVVAKGGLITLKTLKPEETETGGGVREKERVTHGWRTTVSTEQLVGSKTIERVIIAEPPSEISKFSATFEKTTNPDFLIKNFTQPQEEAAIRSQETVITTTRDSKGYIINREKLVTGCAAKGISSFYSAWAGAQVPKPDASTVEPPKSFSIVGVGGDQINSSSRNTPKPMTLLKPTGMFRTVTLLNEQESWSFSKDVVNYDRQQRQPLGAIMPELGNPLFGYQEPSDLSPPVYRDPFPMYITEREVIKWKKDSAGRWESRRTLYQAIGIRNAQEPRDAMESVQYEEDTPERYSRDRADVAIAVATQLKIVSSTLQYSSPPGASPLEENQEVEVVTPYEIKIELDGSDLLNRTIEISPSPFCASMADIRNVAEYAALELRGQTNTTRIGLPLTALPFDIPPNSLIKLANKKYLVVSIASTTNSAQGVLNFDLWQL